MQEHQKSMAHNKTMLASIIAITALIIGVSPAFAEKTIIVELFESEYNTSGTILITGNVDTKKTFVPVILTVYDPNGEIVYKPNLPLESNGDFKWMLKPTLPSFQQGMYAIEAIHADIEIPVTTTFYIEESGTLELVDTQEVPEFGAFTMIVLSVSIIAIIIASTKTRAIKILGN